MTWRRVAPAARRSPTSRDRSTTVREMVLKTRTEPAKSAIAAIIDRIDWKSAVAARIDARRSGGDETT